jgi:kanamycin kinase
VDRKDQRLFFKTAGSGELNSEAAMTRFFDNRGLSAEVLLYETLPTPDNTSGDGSAQRDWLITREVAGEDCTKEMYLSDPKRLCEKMAAILHLLRTQSLENCPIPTRTDTYIAKAWSKCSRILSDTTEHLNSPDDIALTKDIDVHYYTDRFGAASVQDIAKVFQTCKQSLTSDTLVHGDYCLPNIILDNWRFSGFVDLDCSGISDQHIDVFWALWTLQYNLGTHDYDDRFLDAYGREHINEAALRAVAAAEVFG